LYSDSIDLNVLILFNWDATALSLEK